MIISSQNDMESSMQSMVRDGRFASVDDAMTKAAYLLLQELKGTQYTADEIRHDTKPDPVLGSMRDAADERDQIVADAMKRRREEPWRAIPGE